MYLSQPSRNSITMVEVTRNMKTRTCFLQFKIYLQFECRLLMSMICAIKDYVVVEDLDSFSEIFRF